MVLMMSRGWRKDRNRHRIVRHSKTRKSFSLESNTNSGDDYSIPIYAPPSINQLLKDTELQSLKNTLHFKYTEIPISKHCKMEVYKPKKGTVLPLSPEFIKQYIVAFIPEEDRKNLHRIVIANHIPGSEADQFKSLGEYIPPDTLVIYYQKLNSDGTYGSFKYTREEYIARLLFDVIPHEVGHNVDCIKYTKRTKKVCKPSERAERGARAYANQFREKWKIPDSWYYSTNIKPETFSSKLEYAMYKRSKSKTPTKPNIGKI